MNGDDIQKFYCLAFRRHLGPTLQWDSDSEQLCGRLAAMACRCFFTAIRSIEIRGSRTVLFRECLERVWTP